MVTQADISIQLKVTCWVYSVNIIWKSSEFSMTEKYILSTDKAETQIPIKALS